MNFIDISVIERILNQFRLQIDQKYTHQMNPLIDESTIIKYMRIAIEEGQEAIEQNEVAVGCVMVKFGEENTEEIIARSHNTTNKFGNASLHCEINCINQILRSKDQTYDKDDILKKLTLFVTCEPCIMCAYSLALMGIKEVYFGCYNQRFGGNGTILPLNNGKYGAYSYPSFGGFLENECKEILKTFYEKGNLNLEEEKRHRKKTKLDEQDESKL